MRTFGSSEGKFLSGSHIRGHFGLKRTVETAKVHIMEPSLDRNFVQIHKVCARTERERNHALTFEDMPLQGMVKRLSQIQR